MTARQWISMTLVIRNDVNARAGEFIRDTIPGNDAQKKSLSTA